MKTMQVSLEGEEIFKCISCLSPLFTFRDISHYAEKITKEGLRSFLVVQPHAINGSIVVPENPSEDLENDKKSAKTTVVCRQCSTLLGFMLKRASRQKVDLLDRFIIRTESLNKGQLGQQIMELLSERFGQFICEESKQRRERRRKRSELMAELTKAILEIDRSILIEPQKRIQKNQEVASSGPIFRLLPSFTEKDVRPQNLLLRSSFLVLKANRVPRVVVQPNQRSILKRFKQIQPVCEVECSPAEESSKTKVKQCQPTLLRLEQYPVNNFLRYFPLRSKLKERDAPSMAILNSLFVHARLNRTAIFRAVLKQKQKKDKLSKQFLNLIEPDN